MAQRFEDHGLRRFDVVNATAWSSVCYEALSFRVHTVIIHPTGGALYEEYIRLGIFR